MLVVMPGDQVFTTSIFASSDERFWDQGTTLRFCGSAPKLLVLTALPNRAWAFLACALWISGAPPPPQHFL